MAGYYRKRGKESYELTYRGNCKTIKANGDREAGIALAAFIVEVEKGKFRKPTSITVKQFIEDRWIRDYVDVNLAPKTASVYKGYINRRIISSLGSFKLDSVKPQHILDFYNSLREAGIRADGKEGVLKPATILKYHHILSSMFSCAVDWQMIEENPCSRVKPPKVPKRKPVSLDRDPAIALLKALARESLKYRAITLIAACTGMRRGEILGIGEDSLDLVNCSIKIDRASTHVSGRGIILDDPKTKTSIRTVPFPESIKPLLIEVIKARNEQRIKYGDEWQNSIEIHGEIMENKLLFTQWNGKPMHPNTVSAWFSKFRQENGFPETLKFHGLRHTNITLLIKSGVDIGTVADNAGHADKSMTLDYDDALPSASKEIVTKIEEVLALENTVSGLLGKPVNIRRKRNLKSSE